METPQENPKKPGRGGNVPPAPLFSAENQPDAELKKKGWLKKKRAQDLVKALLNQPANSPQLKKEVKEAAAFYGVEEEEITIEVLMVWKQTMLSIKKDHTPAFTAVMDRGFGKPPQKLNFDNPAPTEPTVLILPRGNTITIS